MITPKMLKAGMEALDFAGGFTPSQDMADWLLYEQDVVNDPREAVVRWMFCAMMEAHTRELERAYTSPRHTEQVDAES